MTKSWKEPWNKCLDICYIFRNFTNCLNLNCKLITSVLKRFFIFYAYTTVLKRTDFKNLHLMLEILFWRPEIYLIFHLKKIWRKDFKVCLYSTLIFLWFNGKNELIQKQNSCMKYKKITLYQCNKTHVLNFF